MREVADSFKENKNTRLGRIIYLYSIKYDEVGLQYLRYTNYGKPIEFGGNEYAPYVISHNSLEEDLSGKATNVNLRIANVNRNIQAIVDNYSLNEKQVIIYTVTEENISDPQAYTSDEYSIMDIVTTPRDAVLRLTSPFEVFDVRIPKRYFFRAYCRFKFKDVNCQYAGTENDCNKTLQRCRDLSNTIHFGAFPAIPVQRLLVE
ncbi:hypothetical protein ACFL2J_08165 [Candidatus Omnitrophota bacterium]